MINLNDNQMKLQNWQWKTKLDKTIAAELLGQQIFGKKIVQNVALLVSFKC